MVRMLRVVRAVRSIRTVSHFSGIALVVETIIQSLWDMLNILFLLVIFVVVLSVIGTKLFRKFVPQHFGDPLECAFSIFVCLTQDGWLDIYSNFEQFYELDKFTYYSAIAFFTLTILTAAFVISNLLVAVVTTNLDNAMQEQKEMISGTVLPTADPDDAASQSMLAEFGRMHMQTKLKVVNIAHVNKTVGRHKTKPNEAVNQTPMLHANAPTAEVMAKLENYLLLVTAFDRTVSEQNELVTKLQDINAQVRKLNVRLADDVIQGIKKHRRTTIGERRLAHNSANTDILSGSIRLQRPDETAHPFSVFSFYPTIDTRQSFTLSNRSPRREVDEPPDTGIDTWLPKSPGSYDDVETYNVGVPPQIEIFLPDDNDREDDDDNRPNSNLVWQDIDTRSNVSGRSDASGLSFRIMVTRPSHVSIDQHDEDDSTQRIEERLKIKRPKRKR